jgi:hypothetical protein
MGSLSMTCYTIGTNVTVDPQETEDAPPLPHVPADETNVIGLPTIGILAGPAWCKTNEHTPHEGARTPGAQTECA